MVLRRFRGWTRRRKILTFGAVGVAAIVVAVVLVWAFVWRSDAPPPPSVLERAAALTATSETSASPPEPLAPTAEASPAAPEPTLEPESGAQPSEPSAPAASPAPPENASVEPPTVPAPAPESAAPPVTTDTSPPAPAAADAEPGEVARPNLDGAWSVDTTLGSFEDYTSSWAGYRVGEELAGIGTTDAVGRTPAVSGSLEIAETTVLAASVEVDLTTVVSDRPQRDGLVRSSLDTQQFPVARFELAEPIVFDALPPAGEAVVATVAGYFELHGVSQPVEVTLEATWSEDIVIVGGSFEIRFEDYGISPPRAPVVLSVEDVATVELLLNFTR